MKSRLVPVPGWTIRVVAAVLLTAAPGLARVKFARDVRPILERHCVRCHGEDGAARGLRLDKRERAMMAIVPRRPEDSRVYHAAKSGFMPPGPRKLTPSELEILRKWIAGGAKWPSGMQLQAQTIH